MSTEVKAALRTLGQSQVRLNDPVVTSAARGGPVLNSARVSLVDGFQRVTPQLAAAREGATDALVAHYYPVRHPGLKLVAGKLDLDSIGAVGRRDEGSTLRKAVLAVPHALAGDYPHSPAGIGNKSINKHRALTQHAALVRTLLDNGVEVHLMTRMPHAATEAMYSMDPTSACADTVIVFHMAKAARKLESTMFTGGSRMPGPASAEGGDHLLADHDGVIHYLQGWGSMRANGESVKAVGQFLESLAKERGQAIKHVPIELCGKDTLHIDCVTNYAGEGATRSLVVCPDAIANHSDIELLQTVTGTSNATTFIVTAEEALHGATNWLSVGPNKLIIHDSPYTDRVAGFLESRGIEVIRLDLSESAKKSGWAHCNVGQLLRAP